MALSRPSPGEYAKERSSQFAVIAARKIPVTGDGKVRRQKNGLLDVWHGGKFKEAIQMNAQKSPLLRLPPEIRDRIFRYAVGGNTFEISGPERLYELAMNTTKRKKCLGLLRVCRQIYSETAVLPSTENTFHTVYEEDLNAWAETRLPVEYQAIEQVELRSGWDFYLDPENLVSGQSKMHNLTNLKVVHVQLVSEFEVFNGMKPEEIEVVKGKYEHAFPGVKVVGKVEDWDPEYAASLEWESSIVYW